MKLFVLAQKLYPPMQQVKSISRPRPDTCRGSSPFCHIQIIFRCKQFDFNCSWKHFWGSKRATLRDSFSIELKNNSIDLSHRMNFNQSSTQQVIHCSPIHAMCSPSLSHIHTHTHKLFHSFLNTNNYLLNLLYNPFKYNIFPCRKTFLHNNPNFKYVFITENTSTLVKGQT